MKDCVIEAVTDITVPEGFWNDFQEAADKMAKEIFPMGSVGLRLMNAHEIQRLNFEFRSIDQPTDVLSFPAAREDSEYNGDIALSWDAINHQAKVNGNSIYAEAMALMAHGLLHLAGMDHRNDQEQEEMDRRTRELCNSVGIEVEVFGH